MTHIAIFCVTFNSYDELDSYTASVEEAVKATEGNVSVDMFITDNTYNSPKVISGKYEHIKTSVLPAHNNLGYFGGIKAFMDKTDISKYRYVIISNVDITLGKYALANLAKADFKEDVGWIAPQIYSFDEKRDRNPKITRRYERKKLELLRLFYKYPILNHIYTLTAYRRKKFIQHAPGTIYAGHGSFIILTGEYFKRCGKISYPVFLFGEEIYLAEQCLANNLSVMYEPNIKIYDKEHTSTGKMKGAFYNKCNKEALEYLLKTFY